MLLRLLHDSDIEAALDDLVKGPGLAGADRTPGSVD
jgi:hypothetical protein